MVSALGLNSSVIGTAGRSPDPRLFSLKMVSNLLVVQANDDTLCSPMLMTISSYLAQMIFERGRGRAEGTSRAQMLALIWLFVD